MKFANFWRGLTVAAVMAIGANSCVPLGHLVPPNLTLTQFQLNTISTGTEPAVAVYNNKAYVVFVNGGKVYLTSSDDGVSWTSAQSVSGSDTGVSQPAILVMSNLQRVIMWKLGSHVLRYYYTDASGVAHGPVSLNYDSFEPYAVTNTGNQIHLAYGFELGLEYVSFAFDHPGTPTAGPETFAAVALCLSLMHTYDTHPAIAARSTVNGTEVVIAYYSYTNETTKCQPSDPPPQRYAGPMVFVRTSTGNYTQLAAVLRPLTIGVTLSAAPEPNALSLSVDNNGVYYLAASDVVESVSRVMFASGTVTPFWVASTTNSGPTTPQEMNIAGVANASGNRNAVLAYTQLHLPANYDSTYRQSFAWPTGNAAPTLVASPLLLDSLGRNAKRAILQVCKANGQYCAMNTVFQRLVSGVPKITSDAICPAYCIIRKPDNNNPN